MKNYLIFLHGKLLQETDYWTDVCLAPNGSYTYWTHNRGIKWNLRGDYGISRFKAVAEEDVPKELRVLLLLLT